LITNSVFADNLAEMGDTGTPAGGGGGGINLRGVSATIIHTTVARNKLESGAMQGSGILLLDQGATTPTTATLAYSIIAEHTDPSTAAALHIKPGNTLHLQVGLFDRNTINHGGGGKVTGLDTMTSASPHFRSPGNPDYDYHIEYSSAARNAAGGSTTSVDIDGDQRDAKPDIGADEYMPPGVSSVSLIPAVGNESVEIYWNSQGSIGHHEVVVSCGSGAKDPNEVKCGNALDLGAAELLQLTGLTKEASYTVDIQAFGTDGSLYSSHEISFITNFRFNLLPFVGG
jgi:hypothetical protein